MPRARVPCAKGLGHRGRCSSAAALQRRVASTAVWRAANRERVAASNAAWVAINRERITAWSAVWRAANSERIAAANVVRCAVWRAANSERIAAWRDANREQLAAKRAANREQIAASNAAWAAANPEKIQAKNAVRRARKAGLPATLTSDEWQQIRADYDDCCAYCDDPLDNGYHQDHVIPLSQGGGYTAENIVPACQPCNNQKHARTPEQWVGRAS